VKPATDSASIHGLAVIKIDDAGTVTDANQQAAELMGYETSELIGLDVEKLVPPTLRKQHALHRERFANNPHSRIMNSGEQLVLHTKQGTDIPVEISIHAIERTNEIRCVIEKTVQLTETSPSDSVRSIILNLSQANGTENSPERITEFATQEISKLLDDKLVVFWAYDHTSEKSEATQKFLNGQRQDFSIAHADTSLGSQIGRSIQALSDIHVANSLDDDSLSLPPQILSDGYIGGVAAVVSARHAPAGVITIYFRADKEACDEQDLRFLRQIADAVGFSLSRHSAESSLRRELAIQEVLTRVGQAISRSVSLRDQVAEVAAAVGEIIDHDRFVIASIENAGTYMTENYVAGKSVGNGLHPQIQINGNSGLEDLVLLGVPILQNGAKSRYVSQTSAIEKAHLRAGFKSLLSVPIVWQSNVMGVLSFRSEKEDAYGPEELSMASRVSDLLSGAIANSNLLKKFEFERVKQRTLAEITRVASIDLDLTKVFSRVTEEINRISISLFGPEKSELVLAFLRGIEIPGMRAGNTISINSANFDWKESIDGHAVNLEMVESSADAGPISTLEVTLGTRAAGPIGFIELHRSSTNRYSRTDLDLMVEVAERVTPAVQNSLAHEQQSRLVEAQSRYRELFNNAPDMILAVDVESGLILDHNDTTVSILGYTGDELRRLTVAELYHPDYTNAAFKVFHQFRDVGQVVDAQAKFVRRDGTALDVSINVTAVRDHKGKVVGSISTVRDVSASVEAELAAKNARRLDSENQELVRLNEARSMFLSRVSHELRTPLTALLAFGNILSRNKGNTMTPKQLEQLGYIRNNGWRLEDLINDLLDVSRSEIGTYEIEHHDFELIAVVQETVDSASAIFEQRHQNLYLKHASGPVWVNGDMKRVAQIVSNLLSNSSKFSPDESDIEVRLSSAVGGIEIRITDKGIGISKEDVSRLFTPFFRVDNEQTRRAGGTGLGLVIVKTIVELHGGNVSINSTPGVGTTVKVFLPTIDPKYVAGEDHGTASQSASLNKAS